MSAFGEETPGVVTVELRLVELVDRRMEELRMKL
jgi:hypothetical protein